MGFCIYCGTAIPENAVFCTVCGKKVYVPAPLKPVEPAAAVPPEPAAEVSAPEPVAESAPEPIPAPAEIPAEEPLAAPTEASAEAGEPAPEPEVISAPAVPPVSPAPAVTAAPTPVSGCNPRFVPVSAWRFFGTLMLSGVPVVGLVFLIVWACGACKRENIQNLARAMLLVRALAVVGLCVLIVLVTWIIAMLGYYPIHRLY